MANLNITNIETDKIKPYPNNPRTHDKKQVAKIVKSIKEFGFVNPVLLDENLEIIAGHGRVLAAKEFGMQQVPAIILSHLDENQKRAYRIADNKLTELGEWDLELLNIEFTNLSALDLDFDLEITGFETTEIDLIIGGSTTESNPKEDSTPVLNDEDNVCKHGDLWQLGNHFLICGDSLQLQTYKSLLGDKTAQMVLTDPPYNVKVKNIGSMGKIKHEEFAMASGEMTKEQFTEFLTTVMQNLKAFSTDGSLHYLFIDWKHFLEIGTAGNQVYDELKNICTWVKSSGGMGSLYRSQHEFCFVYKNGKAPHINNVELGANGRYRTNVWKYEGANSFGEGKDNLKLHPTVKPVTMLKDAILDVTKRGDIVLDAFLGSGSTLIACEQTGRICYGIELEEKYCNVTIKRWQELTGKKAVKIDGGKND